MTSAIPLYESFIVQLGGEHAGPAPDQRRWRGQIEHVQSGRQWRFATIPEIAALIDAYLADQRPAAGERRQEEDAGM
jgi:hypothetical protein